MQKRDLGRVLITGADGFIGSHLCEMLVEQGYSVTALCIYNSEGKYGWLNELAQKAPKNLELILGDVRDVFQMNEISKGMGTIFHLAALIAIPYSYVAPQSYLDTNIQGTLNLLQAAKANKVGRVIHTSTSEVYGTAQFVPITESHPLQGQSPYSASKIAADMLAESYYRSFDLPVTTLRPFNTFGPRQSYRAVIPSIIGQILNGRRQIHLGSLHPTRDFNFVTNTAQAFLSLAQASDQVLGQTYNASSGKEISIGDLVKLISTLLDIDITVTCDEQRIRPEKSEVERLLGDASKLMGVCEWKPLVDLKAGLEKTIEWQKQNDKSLLGVKSYQR